MLLVGAGASIEYNAPSTNGVTRIIEQRLSIDPIARKYGADEAFEKIRTSLAGYLHDSVHFEHIFHCAHELLMLEKPASTAFDEFRPILLPFVSDDSGISTSSLRVLVEKMGEIIFSEFSEACSKNPISLSPLENFISTLRSRFTTRIYTTNYDDFILQAAPDLFTGFVPISTDSATPFDFRRWWEAFDQDSIAYLHGSVHLGFATPPLFDIGELAWFADRNEARKRSVFHGGNVRRMDGSQFLRTAVITGFDKLTRLQQRPFSHFYATLARDLMAADVILVIGSGLADLHLNAWLSEARSRTPRPPLIFVDRWVDGYLDAITGKGRKEIELFHALKVQVSNPGDVHDLGDGWVIAANSSAAIWERGFQAFLNSGRDLEDVMAKLRPPR